MNLFCIKSGKSRFGIPPAAEERFREMVRDLLWLSLGLLVILQLPWIAELLIPKTDVVDSVWYRSILQKLTPLIALAAFGVIMFFACLDQNLTIGAFFRERGRESSGWLWIPVIRNFHFLATFDNPDFRCRLLGVTQIVATPVAWLIWLSSGPMNFYGMLVMSLGIFAGIRQVKLLTGITMTKRQRICGFILSCLFLISLIAGYSMLYHLDFQLEAERLQWRSSGIPTTMSEAEEFYFRGIAPDPKFTELCDRYVKRPYSDTYCSSPSRYYTQPESERQKVHQYLESKQAELDFDGIEQLIESKLFLKYQVQIKTPASDTLIPHANYEREVTRWFSARIIRAVESKNRIEAMKLFRLMTKFQETVLRNNSGVGAQVAIACEYIRCETVGALLGSGILANADLEKLKEYNLDREKRLRLAVRDGIRDYAYLDSEAQYGFNEFYSDFERAYTADQRSEAENSFLFFCRVPLTAHPTGIGFLQGRGNRRSPLFLWTEVCSTQEFLNWMRLARRNVDYYNTTGDYFRHSTKRTALQNAVPKNFYIFPVNFHLAKQYARVVTQIRMCELALNIEEFRRQNGRLPKTLSELDGKLPMDALSGEGFRFTPYARVFWSDYKGGSIPRDFPGWQLSAPGGNFVEPGSPCDPRAGRGSITRLADTPKHEAKRDYFTVILQWPLPAPPEPPKLEGNPFGFFGQPKQQPETKP